MPNSSGQKVKPCKMSLDMNSDYKAIRCLFKLGGTLGVSPTWNGKINIFRKLYCLVLIALSVVGTIFSLMSRYSTLLDLDMKPAQVFLESCECVSELSFMLSCFIGVMFKEKIWKKYIHDIDKVEEQLNSLGFMNNKNIYGYLFQVLILHAVFLVIQTYETLTWIEVEGMTLQDGYILGKIFMYYQFYVVYLLVSTTQMLKSRYLFLRKFIEDILEEKSAMVVISFKDDKKVIAKFSKIQKIYGTLYNTVQEMNRIYGWIMFFYFTTYILTILGNLNYGLKYMNEDVTLNETIALDYVMYTGFHTISTIVIVMSCDGVEQCGKKIVKTCFLYREILEKPYLKEELMLFAKFAKQLSPKFSAAGFFRVNQSLLPTLFSAVTTYLIIIIQFNMAL